MEKVTVGFFADKELSVERDLLREVLSQEEKRDVKNGEILQMFFSSFYEKNPGLKEKVEKLKEIEELKKNL